jgi:hypothetical protein
MDLKAIGRWKEREAKEERIERGCQKEWYTNYNRNKWSKGVKMFGSLETGERWPISWRCRIPIPRLIYGGCPPFSFRSIVEGEKLQKVTGSLPKYRPLWSQELLHLLVFFFFRSYLNTDYFLVTYLVTVNRLQPSRCGRGRDGKRRYLIVTLPR